MARMAKMTKVLARDRLLAELRKRGGTRRDLARRADMTSDYADELLRGLEAHGLAKHSRDKKAGSIAFWWEATTQTEEDTKNAD